MILHLLTLRCASADECSAADLEIRAICCEFRIDEEVFLFDTECGDDLLGGRVAEDAHESKCLLRDCLNRAQKRRLLVECFAGVAHEDSGNAKCRVRADFVNERWARCIPRGVAARFIRIANATVRKTRRIGFTLHKLRAAELFDRASVGVDREKSIVLLGGQSGERLEPVAVMRRAIFDRPILHRSRDGVGDLGVKRRACVDCLLQVHEDIRR